MTSRKKKKKLKDNNSVTNFIKRNENVNSSGFDMEYEVSKIKKCIVLTLSLIHC